MKKGRNKIRKREGRSTSWGLNSPTRKAATLVLEISTQSLHNRKEIPIMFSPTDSIQVSCCRVYNWTITFVDDDCWIFQRRPLTSIIEYLLSLPFRPDISAKLALHSTYCRYLKEQHVIWTIWLVENAPLESLFSLRPAFLSKPDITNECWTSSSQRRKINIALMTAIRIINICLAGIYTEIWRRCEVNSFGFCPSPLSSWPKNGLSDYKSPDETGGNVMTKFVNQETRPLSW